MGRIFESKAAIVVVSRIHDAFFGHPGMADRRGGSINDIRALSQEFSLSAPAGGGAIMVIHALGHQNCQSRMSLRD